MKGVSELMAEETKSKLSIWHILIVVATFLMMFVGTQTSASFSLIVNAIKEEAGFTGTQSSMIFTVRNIAAMIFVFVGGKYFEKVGSRIAVTSAFVLGIIAMGIMYFAGDNLIMYYVGAVVLGGAYAYSMMLPMALVIRKWFNKDRALAMSICSAGTGLSGFIMSPILQGIKNNSGVASAILFMAIVFAVVGVIYFLIARSAPEDMGLEPYGGYDWVEPSKEGEVKKKPVTETNAKAVLGFAACALIMGMMSPVSQSHFVMHFNTEGYDSMLVASAYGVVGLCLLFSKLGFGALTKIFKKFENQCALFFLLYFIALGGTFLAGTMGIVANWVPFAVCVIFGIAGASCSLSYPNWVADFSTRDDYPKNAKNCQFGYQIGEIIAVSVPGMIFDATGHYTGWYGIAALFAVAISIIMFYFYGQKRKAEAAETAAA